MREVVARQSARLRTSSPLNAFSAAVALGIALPLVVAAVTGSLTIPHNDGWAYSRIAETFGISGHIRLVGWNRMFLVGQIVVLGPLARWVIAQQLFVAATGLLALAATFVLLRPRIGTRRAMFASAVVAAWPGFGLLSTSFMTDVPSYAASTATLVLGDVALRRRSSWLLLGAFAVGLWGVSIREQSVAALIAVAVAALGDGEQRRRTVALLIPLVALCLALERWRRGLPNSDPPSLHVISASSFWWMGAHAYFTLAAPLLPLTVAVSPRRWRKTSWLVAVVAAGVGARMVRISLSNGVPFFVGNYLTPYVAYRQVSDGAPRVIPDAVWKVVLVAAIASGALLAGAVVEHWRRLDLLVGGFTLVSLLIIAGESTVGQPVFDRYLLVVVPGCAVLTLGGRETRVGVSNWVALVGVAIVSVVLLVATMAYDGARWRTAERLPVPATDIDAGLEWVGAHAALPVARVQNASAGPWYYPLLPASPNCNVITGPSALSVQHVGHFVRAYSYSWFLGTHRLLLFRRC